jgi:hypothetical protein
LNSDINFTRRIKLYILEKKELLCRSSFSLI